MTNELIVRKFFLITIFVPLIIIIITRSFFLLDYAMIRVILGTNALLSGFFSFYVQCYND